MARLSDADFLALLNSVIATISGNLAAYAPLVAADMTALGTLRDGSYSAWSETVSATITG